MIHSSTISAEPSIGLGRFLDANPGVDLHDVNLADPMVLAGSGWPDGDQARAQLLESLRGYQRLLRLMPGADRRLLLQLLDRGIRSAIHIAAIPRPQFLSEFAELFAGDVDRMRVVHDDAVARRSTLLLRYVRARQNLELRARPISPRGAQD